MVQVTVQLGEDDAAAVDRWRGNAGLTRSALIRALVRAGLEAVRRDPTALIGGGQ